jgi:hypothetical protein
VSDMTREKGCERRSAGQAGNRFDYAQDRLCSGSSGACELKAS